MESEAEGVKFPTLIDYLEFYDFPSIKLNLNLKIVFRCLRKDFRFQLFKSTLTFLFPVILKGKFVRLLSLCSRTARTVVRYINLQLQIKLSL